MPTEIDPGEREAILSRARERAQAAGAAYNGNLTPLEAGQLVHAGVARVIDVRSRFEWEFVGRVPDSALVEWRIYEPDGADRLKARPNEQFVEQLRAIARPQETLLVLCRSGVRSQGAAAAAVAAGFANAFNILEGFEGDPDPHKHRGQIGGWRKHGLPWIQG